MRFVVGSIVVHVLVLVVLLRGHHPASSVIAHAPAERNVETETELVVEVVAAAAPSNGGGSSGVDPAAARPRHTVARSRSAPTASAWDQVEISNDRAGGGDGHGSGGGRGDGRGTGIGFGAGGGIGAPQLVPEPPHVELPPPSRARPATLIYPVRDREVDDEGNLFIARITVDTDGDVIGAHMIKTRPGVTGDQASSAIWTFRYLPALDDRGTPIRSTFEQPFQIR